MIFPASWPVLVHGSCWFCWFVEELGGKSHLGWIEVEKPKNITSLHCSEEEEKEKTKKEAREMMVKWEQNGKGFKRKPEK